MRFETGKPKTGESSTLHLKTARLGTRLAVPVFMGRVAPVLDACTCLLIVDLDEAMPEGRRIFVKGNNIPDRVQEIIALGVTVIICGALSEMYFSRLTQQGIHLICGIAGDTDKVISAYKTGTLQQACFRMPGAGSGHPQGTE